VRLITLILALAFAAPASAQAPSDFRQEFLGQFNNSAAKFEALAEAMPEQAYDWRPAEGVASVVEVLMHVARYNYLYPDQNLGMGSPVEYAGWEAEITDKEEAMETLIASMDHVRSALGAMSDDELDEPTMLYGRQVGSWAVMLQLVAHMNEHLGQSIAYARMNGVVPPWSR